MAKLRSDETSALGDFNSDVTYEFFTETVFRISTARTATFVLLLCTAEPRSFISGNNVDLEDVLQAYNRHEFHHMYPQVLLKEDNFAPEEISCLANMCILSRADNNKIRRRKPSEYRELMPDGSDLSNILRGAIAKETLFTDDYLSFRDERQDVGRGCQGAHYLRPGLDCRTAVNQRGGDINFSAVESAQDAGPLPRLIAAASRAGEEDDIVKAVHELYPAGRLALAIVDNRHWRRFSDLASRIGHSGKFHVSTISGRTDVEGLGYRRRG
jgi:hypothetical protein